MGRKSPVETSRFGARSTTRNGFARPVSRITPASCVRLIPLRNPHPSRFPNTGGAARRNPCATGLGVTVASYRALPPRQPDSAPIRKLGRIRKHSLVSPPECRGAPRGSTAPVAASGRRGRPPGRWLTAGPRQPVKYTSCKGKLTTTAGELTPRESLVSLPERGSGRRGGAVSARKGAWRWLAVGSQPVRRGMFCFINRRDAARGR